MELVNNNDKKNTNVTQITEEEKMKLRKHRFALDTNLSTFDSVKVRLYQNNFSYYTKRNKRF